MKAIVNLNKEDLNKQILEYLNRRGFQLAKDKEIDWRFRPSLHVLAEVDAGGMSEEEWRSLAITELRSMMAEMQSHGYEIETSLVGQILSYLDAREKGITSPKTLAKIAASDRARLPPSVPSILSTDKIAVAADPSIDSQLQEILASSRKLQKGESIDDPRIESKDE